MKLAAGILTWNHNRTNRRDLFLRCVDSIKAANVPYIVVTNGSDDGTEETVRQMGGIVDNTNGRCYYGMTLAADWAMSTGADYILFSADDMEYRPGWAGKLAAFWDNAPDNIVLATLQLEPLYPWNAITGIGDAGGLHYITRTSLGGCCWSWRARDYDKIFPLPPIQPAEDLRTCEKLMRNGYAMAALDLADHAGEKQSSWGNASWTYAVYPDWKEYGF